MEESEIAGTESWNIELGRKGESTVAGYLKNEQYEVLERNWRCPFGEADIIALKDGILVFIEVKSRSGDAFGPAEDAVGKAKRARYEKIAACYLADHHIPNCQVRFDVAAVLFMGPDRGIIRYHMNAFACGD